MKKVLGLWVLAILFLCSNSWAGEAAVGHVAFFSTGSVKTDDDFEVQDDFDYYYNQLVPWFKQNGFSHSYHTSTPITFSLDKGKSIVIGKDQLQRYLGMIYCKMDGTYKISYGVGTDIDTIMAIKDFLILSNFPSTSSGQALHKKGMRRNYCWLVLL